MKKSRLSLGVTLAILFGVSAAAELVYVADDIAQGKWSLALKDGQLPIDDIVIAAMAPFALPGPLRRPKEDSKRSPTATPAP